jgi:hypothetical protein
MARKQAATKTFTINRATSTSSSGHPGLPRRTVRSCKAQAVLTLFIFATSLPANDRIGIIDFFGYKGYDIARLRTAIPYRVGDPLLVTPENLETIADVRQGINYGVQAVTHHPATDVAMVCCDVHGDWEIYIGIDGRSIRTIRRNREPKGPARLPAEPLQLYAQYMTEWPRVVQAKLGRDDESNGYALSPDPKLRVIEVSMRQYALAHEDLFRHVLASSSDSHHRLVAATFTGYARQSPQQISALVAAIRDADDAVRNNAIRALGVLVSARKISLPATGFIEMLSSGTWSDRNKALMVLLPLTEPRDARLLARLRANSLEALTEMSHWQCPDHSAGARELLSRISAPDVGR